MSRQTERDELVRDMVRKVKEELSKAEVQKCDGRSIKIAICFFLEEEVPDNAILKRVLNSLKRSNNCCAWALGNGYYAVHVVEFPK